MTLRLMIVEDDEPLVELLRYNFEAVGMRSRRSCTAMRPRPASRSPDASPRRANAQSL